MNWFYLFMAGLFEIGWPLGLKFSQSLENKYLGIPLALVSLGLSGVFLWLAQRTIPMGTAYAIWTGIGAIGTFTIGVLFFKDSASMLRIGSVLFIVVGVVGLKIAQ